MEGSLSHDDDVFEDKYERLKKKSRTASYEEQEYDDSGKPPRPKRPKKIRTDGFDDANSITIYPDLDNDKTQPLTISTQSTHTAPQLKVSEDGMSVSTGKGYRMAKATHGVWEGNWYYEAKVNAGPNGHVRIGFSQISGDLQAPCGYDMFSYSIRDQPGSLFHKARQCRAVNGAKEFADGFETGDTIGFVIRIPIITNKDDMEDLLSREWDPVATNGFYMPYKRKSFKICRDSSIEVYKNGIFVGVAFKNISCGKYYPAVSCFNGASVEVNFGPNFEYDVPENAQGYHLITSKPNYADIKEMIEMGTFEERETENGASISPIETPESLLSA